MSHQPARDVGQVEEKLRSFLPPHSRSVDATRDLRDVGLDSFDVVEFLLSIEGHYKVHLNEDEFIRNPSLRQLATLIAERSS